MKVCSLMINNGAVSWYPQRRGSKVNPVRVHLQSMPVVFHSPAMLLRCTVGRASRKHLIQKKKFKQTKLWAVIFQNLDSMKEFCSITFSHVLLPLFSLGGFFFPLLLLHSTEKCPDFLFTWPSGLPCACAN
ncbi:hypothetical protein HJG60_010474 [Phyllostomus discolor]|uniref:Uncharacterized protein n=1 Tax=Phyllostomus discolor TaxID=89673 RepID=A0A834AL78_9CHIR|nr:hypothetical protein HJG60_010474 [Phyllostomus discolor]